MEMVGVRELRENLSRYLKRIKSGESIIVTERKNEVAIILPYEKEDNENEKVLQLIQRGIVYWSGGKPKGLPSRISSKGKNVSDAVIEDRR